MRQLTQFQEHLLGRQIALKETRHLSLKVTAQYFGSYVKAYSSLGLTPWMISMQKEPENCKTDIPNNPDAEPPCSHTKSALIVFGKHAGRTLTVCVEPDCPVHVPREAARVAAAPPPVMAPAAEQETEEEPCASRAGHNAY